VHADDALLRHDGHFCEPLLDVSQHGM
jgi:hypothetical protein